MKKSRLLIVFSVATILFSGCGTEPHRMDPTGNEGITTVRDLDFKDYQVTAEDLINKLVASNKIPRQADGLPPVLMVARLKNSTAAHLDMQLLTQKITIALDKSGQARTTTRVYKDGEFDTGTTRARNLSTEEGFDAKTLQKEATLQAPRYSLSGEITELFRTQGRTQESYYQIYLTVTDVRTGLAVWQDAKEVVKQETRPWISL